MTNDERRTIIQFMNAVLYKQFPNIQDMPMQDMKSKEWKYGECFDGSPYQDKAELIQAFYMWDAIEKMEAIQQTRSKR